MIVLGLTGSIGMGKSTTALLFAEEGVPVHDADAAVHSLYAGEAVAPVEAAFPGVTADGVIDRKKLAAKVVGKEAAMKRLEAIVHPLVRQAETRFLDTARAAGAAIAVLDVPLLFESGAADRVDAVAVVTAPPEVQRERVFSRGVSEEQFAALLARQMPDAQKRARADFLIDTSQGIEPARTRVREILAALKQRAKPVIDS